MRMETAMQAGRDDRFEQLSRVLSLSQLGDVASDHRGELQGYHGWNFLAIQAVAKQAARSLVYVYDDSKDPTSAIKRQIAKSEHGTRWRKSLVSDHQGEILESTHPLVCLLKNPNPYQTAESFQWERIQQLRLHGSCLVWERPSIGINGAGQRTVERYVIPLALITPVTPGQRSSMPYGGIFLSPRRYQAFALQGADTSEALSVLAQFIGGYIGMEHISIVRYPHPYIKGDGASPTSAASIWIDSGTSIDRTRLDFYRYGPYGKIIMECEGTPEQVKVLQDKLNRDFGPDGPTIICVGNGKAVLAQKDVDDMGFNEGHEQMADAVLAMQGIGKALVGKQDGLTYGSLAASMKAAIAVSIQPDMDLIAGADTLSLCHQFGQNLTVEYEVPQIDDPDLEDKRLASDVVACAITYGEYRRKRGEPLLGNELDDYIMTPNGPVSQDELIRRGSSAATSVSVPGGVSTTNGGTGTPQMPQTDEISSSAITGGSFTGLTRREVQNINRGIDDALRYLRSGEWSVARARVFLGKLDLDENAIEALLNEFTDTSSTESKSMRLFIDGTLLKSLDGDMVEGITLAGVDLISIDDFMTSEPDFDLDPTMIWTWEQGTNIGLLHKSLPAGCLKSAIESVIEPEQPVRKYGCVLLPLPDEATTRMLQLGQDIPDLDLGSGGRETEPHVTALYGIIASDPEEVVKALQRCEQPLVQFGDLQAFPAGDDGQPLFVSVKSPDMAKINMMLRNALPHAVTHPNYTPHATVAYVKDASTRVGTQCSLSGQACYLTKAIISMPGFDKVVVPLRRPYIPPTVPKVAEVQQAGK